MHGRRRPRTAAAGGGAALLAVVLLAAVHAPLTTGAKVTPTQGGRVLVEESPSGCSAGFCYAPADIDIRDGATVTWFNNSAAAHTVTRCTPAACAGQGPGDGPDALGDSGPFANGASWFFTFRTPGRYVYYCSLHGYRVMHGSVTVHAAGPQATPTPAQPLGVPLPGTP
ncbi:MAG TPA: plastocyanin/azurin family copper-binding protein [Candidatus Dormibacteraeota bacterium]